MENCVDDITALKKHLLRCKNQEQARTHVAENLQENDILITVDWAMKFLPRKYREGMVDWFWKRGINWHIAVSLIKAHDGFQTVSHIHIFRGQIPQDAPTTAAIICDVIDDLKVMVPGLGHIYIISDNAGCYKCSQTILTIHHMIGPKLVSYDFSEPQTGIGNSNF